MLDYGCGSGILAIAALKLGAAEAIAYDIDPQALLATRENAERNGVAGRLRVVAEHPESLPPANSWSPISWRDHWPNWPAGSRSFCQPAAALP